MALAQAYTGVANARVLAVSEYEHATVRSYEIASDDTGAFYAIRYSDVFGDESLPIAQYVSCDGQTLLSQVEPYVYNEIPYSPLKPGEVDTNLLSVPWPVLPALVQVLLDASDTETSTSADGALSAQSASAGIRIEWQPANQSVLSVSRLVAGQPLLTYQYSGFDRSRPPLPTVCSVIFKDGLTGIDPEVYLVHEARFNTPEASSLLESSPPEGYYRRDAKTSNVYNQQGELRYNAKDRDRKLDPRTSESSQWLVWGTPTALACGTVFLIYYRRHSHGAG